MDSLDSPAILSIIKKLLKLIKINFNKLDEKSSSIIIKRIFLKSDLNLNIPMHEEINLVFTNCYFILFSF